MAEGKRAGARAAQNSTNQTIPKLTIENRVVSLDELRPHPRNYNGHSSAQVKKLAAALKKFGQRKPLTTWRNIVLTGHGVFEAAKLLGLTEIWIAPCPDEWTEAEALAWLAADNELGRQSDPDMAQLVAILEESRAHDGELLEAMGYSEEEFSELLAQLDRINNQDAEPQEAEADRLAETWGTGAGQLWQCGEHRVLCGDSSDADAWARLLGNELIDCVWTDPPYGVDYGGKNEMLNAIAKGNRIQTPITDDEDPATAIEAARATLRLAYEYARPGAAIYMCAPPGAHMVSFIAAFRAAGFEHHQTLIWVKNGIVLGRHDYNYQHEPIVYGWKPGAAHTWADIAPGTSVIDDEAAIRRMGKPQLIALIDELRNERRSDVLRISKPQASRLHPTTKPTALIVATMKNNTYPGHLVADPFGGSGSSMIAAQQIERRARLIELSPAYVAVTLQRYQEATGQTPTLLETT